MMNKKMTGYKDGGSAAKGAKKAIAAIKRLRMESGAAISEKEIDGIVEKLLREESGAAITKAEREAVKKTVLNAARQKPRKMNMGGAAAKKMNMGGAAPKKMNMGGAATKNKRPPSSSNCGLYGRVQGKMGGGKMKPIGMKGGGMPNIGSNLRRP